TVPNFLPPESSIGAPTTKSLMPSPSTSPPPALTYPAWAPDVPPGIENRSICAGARAATPPSTSPVAASSSIAAATLFQGSIGALLDRDRWILRSSEPFAPRMADAPGTRRRLRDRCARPLVARLERTLRNLGLELVADRRGRSTARGAPAVGYTPRP